MTMYRNIDGLYFSIYGSSQNMVTAFNSDNLKSQFLKDA